MTNPVTEAMIDAAVAAIDEFPFSNGPADDRAPIRAALEAALKLGPAHDPERIAQLQYEAGMYQSLYENLKSGAAQGQGLPSREAIAKVIDPVAFDPISLGDKHPGWECRRETATETADKILDLAGNDGAVEPIETSDLINRLLDPPVTARTGAEAADTIIGLQSAINKLKKAALGTAAQSTGREAALEAALRFYANPKNYSDDYWKGIWKTAQEALAALPALGNAGATCVRKQCDDHEWCNTPPAGCRWTCDPVPSTDSAWQPIETAPQDGPSFLVWVPENLCTYLVIARNGRFEIFGGGYRDKIQRATHWMHLPSSPQSQTAPTCEHGNHLETCTVCLMWRQVSSNPRASE